MVLPGMAADGGGPRSERTGQGLRRLLGPGARNRLGRVAAVVGRPLASIESVVTSRPVLALTFDDGPDPDVTPAILDVLAGTSARCTFFVLAQRAEAHPRLVRRMVDEGHELGVHSVDHRHLPDLRGSELTAQILGARDRIAAVGGVRPALFRPPFGEQTVRSLVRTRRHDMRVVLWSDWVEDWVDQPADEVRSRMTAAARRGGILLFHDGLAAAPGDRPPRTSFDRATVVRGFLDDITAQGLAAVTTSELLQLGRPRRRFVIW